MFFSGCATSETEVPKVQAKLSTDSPFFDFDTISMKNGVVSHMFEVENNGEEPIVINKVYTTCMCTTVDIMSFDKVKLGSFGMPGHGGADDKAKIMVGQGEKILIEAHFDPAAHGPSGIGMIQRSIFLESNSLSMPKMELSFRAMVTN